MTYFRSNVNALNRVNVQLSWVIIMYRRIRDLREDKDLSQSEIAAIIGMSRTGYSKYETGENDIPTDILKQLAKLHNTSVDYLLELTNEKEPYR